MPPIKNIRIKIVLLAFLLIYKNNLKAQAVFISNCAPYPNYTITIKATPINLVIKNPAAWGCNVDVVFAYTVSIAGTIPNGWCGGGAGGTLNNAKVSISCSGRNFEVDIPRSASSGTVMSGNNQGINIPNCTGVTINSLCNGVSMNTTISGPGIAGSTKTLNNALPIELIEFSANQNGTKNVLLNWSTATELHNEFFTVERSSDAINWEAISTIKGAGTSSSIKHYNYEDVSPNNSLNYYRLKQTDFNSSYKYSNIVYINLFEKSTSYLTLFPNPANQTLSVFGITNATDVDLINNLGQKVNINYEMIDECIKLDTKDLIEGLYTIIVRTDSESLSSKLIILH